MESTIFKKRLSWVDNVKMVAMLFVIFGHTWRIIHYPLPEWVGLFILSFNMALFVMMTGYTSVHTIDKISTKQDLLRYIEKITKRILLPSTVFNSLLALIVISEKLFLGEEVSWKWGLLMLTILVVYVIAFFYRKTLQGRKLFDFLCILTIPLSIKFSSFWFLNMIWCVCLSIAIGSYLQKKLNWGGYLVLYLLAFLISLIFNIGHDKTSDFVHYFLIGYALFKFEVLTSLHYKNFWMCICLILGCFIVKGIGEEGMNFWEFHFKEFLFGYSLHIYILRILASTLICVFFVLLIKNVSREYGKFSFWGSKALPLYMVHALFINIFYNLPIYYELKGFYYFIYAIPATVLLTFASMLLIKLFMKYDLTQTYCLGEIK